MAFGYSDAEILEIFHNKPDESSSQKRLNNQDDTLTQLVEGSCRLIKEDLPLLKEIYAPKS